MLQHHNRLVKLKFYCDIKVLFDFRSRLPFLNSHGYIMLLRFYQTKSTLPKYFDNINKKKFENLNIK